MSNDIQREMDVALVERMFSRYPKLDTIICAGTVSLKATREILCIDRYECYQMYLDLLEAGAIYGSGSNCYRATPQLKEYMRQRKVTESATKNLIRLPMLVVYVASLTQTRTAQQQMATLCTFIKSVLRKSCPRKRKRRFGGSYERIS